MTTNLKLFIVILFTSYMNRSVAQLNHLMNDSVNNIFYRALLWDGLSYYYSNEEILKFCQENVKLSQKINFKMSYKHNVYFYSIRTLELNFNNDEIYIILHFETDNGISIYFRLYGFKENDFIHLYHRILKPYHSNKKKVLEHLSVWQKNDAVLSKVDFQELLIAVWTMNNEVPSMISHQLIARNSTIPTILSPNAQIYYDEFFLRKKVYAYFSNRPLDGSLPDDIVPKKKIFKN